MTHPRSCRRGLLPGIEGAQAWHESLEAGLDVAGLPIARFIWLPGLLSLEGPDSRYMLSQPEQLSSLEARFWRCGSAREPPSGQATLGLGSD